ncbi:hypothetical protein NBRC116587_22660 [Pseudoteredinibacter isoporae]
MDATANGRRIKILTIVDDFTRESLDLVVSHSISGDYVARVLDAIAQFRGYPSAIRTDQGPEFTSKALDQWAYEHRVALKLIQPGKPTQNAYIESFNPSWIASLFIIDQTCQLVSLRVARRLRQELVFQIRLFEWPIWASTKDLLQNIIHCGWVIVEAAVSVAA